MWTFANVDYRFANVNGTVCVMTLSIRKSKCRSALHNGDIPRENMARGHAMWKDQPLCFLGHGRNTNPMATNAKNHSCRISRVYMADFIALAEEEAAASFLLARSLRNLEGVS